MSTGKLNTQNKAFQMRARLLMSALPDNASLSLVAAVEQHAKGSLNKVELQGIESFEGTTEGATEGSGALLAGPNGSECLEQMITQFLEHNPEPSDSQVHALAFSLGVDKETLEAQMYSMLSDLQNADNGATYRSAKQENFDMPYDDLNNIPSPGRVRVNSKGVRASLLRSSILKCLGHLLEASGNSAKGLSQVEALTDEEKVLQDDYDPNATRSEDLMLNDGVMVHQAVEDEYQGLMVDDGEVMPTLASKASRSK